MFPQSSPAPAGLMSFPHASGGVSPGGLSGSLRDKFSPREWGCFLFPLQRRYEFLVFPTRVGVFPGEKQAAPFQRSFPHASGGVSYAFVLHLLSILFSPREWGCFYLSIYD